MKKIAGLSIATRNLNDYTYTSMKKPEGIFVFLFAVLWIGILFAAFIFGIKKSFRPPPKSEQKTAAELLREQRQKNDDIQEQQRRLMEDRKQKLRDRQRSRWNYWRHNLVNENETSPTAFLREHAVG